MIRTTLQPLPQPYRAVLIEEDQPKVLKLLEDCWNETKESIELPGFDKGQVPRSIAEKKLGEVNLYKSVIDVLVKEGLIQIPERFCSIENVAVTWQTEKTPLVLTVYGYLTPKVIKCDYKSLASNYRRLMVSDEEINTNLLRVAYGEAEEIEIDPTVIKDYDINKLQVIIDFLMDDVEKQQIIASQKDFRVNLLKRDFGFEEAILEHKKDDMFQVNCTLPENFFNRELAGRKVSYQIKIVKIFTLKMPEINDDLARKVGYEDLATMRTFILTDLEAEKRKANGMLFRDHLMSLLVTQTETTPVPDALLKKETEIMLIGAVRNANRMQKTNMTVEEFLVAAKITQEDWDNSHWTLARKKLIGNLALEYLAEQEKIIPTEEECRKLLKEMLPENTDIVEEKIDQVGLKHYALLKRAQDFLVNLYERPVTELK